MKNQGANGNGLAALTTVLVFALILALTACGQSDEILYDGGFSIMPVKFKARSAKRSLSKASEEHTAVICVLSVTDAAGGEYKKGIDGKWYLEGRTPTQDALPASVLVEKVVVQETGEELSVSGEIQLGSAEPLLGTDESGNPISLSATLNLETESIDFTINAAVYNTGITSYSESEDAEGITVASTIIVEEGECSYEVGVKRFRSSPEESGLDFTLYTQVIHLVVPTSESCPPVTQISFAGVPLSLEGEWTAVGDFAADTNFSEGTWTGVTIGDTEYFY